MADYHRVWKVRLSIPDNLKDPDLPSPRYHTCLFVEKEGGIREDKSSRSTTDSIAPFSSNARFFFSESSSTATEDALGNDASATGAVIAGTIHEVTGDLVTGMQYCSRHGGSPQDEPMFYDKTLLGVVSGEQYPGRFEEVCRDQKPPPKQKKFNIRTMRTEPVKSDGEFYKQGEKREKLVKCTEWTEEQAIPALWNHRILQQINVGDL